MDVERVLGKLRWDGPCVTGRKWLQRQRWRVARRARRARWAAADPGVAPSDVPSEVNLRGAEEIWPGAADRSWQGAARGRWPELHAAAARVAEAAARGEFDLLGSGPVSLRGDGGRIRWHEDFKAGAPFPADCLYLDVPICLPQLGTDIKVPWELSRFQHVFPMVWTDPDRYGPVFLGQWRDWMAANPVARGVNWACTMDVALRAVSWTAAAAAWGRTWDSDTLRRMAAALAAHGHFVRGNLEWAVPVRTNHYFTDLVGLSVLGAVLRPYGPAAEWSAFAARELGREMLEEFAPDGFGHERSTAYHRLMVELATLGLLASRAGGHGLGSACRDRLAAAYRAIALVTTDLGRGPLVGDNDSGRVFPMAPREDEALAYVLPIGAELLGRDDLALGEAPPELALLGGPAALARYDARPRARRPQASAALADSGFFVLGDDRDRLIVRCGPLTYRPADGHGHLDDLSLMLFVDGREILVDPGQYCYTPWPEWRNRLRYAQSHNTVVVDDQQPCRVFFPGRMVFSVINESVPRCREWSTGEDGGRFVGTHRGYRRLPGGSDIERTVEYSRARRTWTVTDRLALSGHHECRWYFHLHPECAARAAEGGWDLVRGESRVTLRWLGGESPTARSEAGWYAPAYGRKVPASVLSWGRKGSGAVTARLELTLDRERR